MRLWDDGVMDESQHQPREAAEPQRLLGVEGLSIRDANDMPPELGKGEEAIGEIAADELGGVGGGVADLGPAELRAGMGRNLL